MSSTTHNSNTNISGMGFNGIKMPMPGLVGPNSSSSLGTSSPSSSSSAYDRTSASADNYNYPSSYTISNGKLPLNGNNTQIVKEPFIVSSPPIQPPPVYQRSTSECFEYFSLFQTSVNYKNKGLIVRWLYSNITFVILFHRIRSVNRIKWQNV